MGCGSGCGDGCDTTKTGNGQSSQQVPTAAKGWRGGRWCWAAACCPHWVRYIRTAPQRPPTPPRCTTQCPRWSSVSQANSSAASRQWGPRVCWGPRAMPRARPGRRPSRGSYLAHTPAQTAYGERQVQQPSLRTLGWALVASTAHCPPSSPSPPPIHHHQHHAPTGTRESLQPIHRYSGFCCSQSRSKNLGSAARRALHHSL